MFTQETPQTIANEVPAGSLRGVAISQRRAWGLRECCEQPIFNSATPVKRRGKSMSRRTGQSGHIEKSGKWWVVRWWMDLEGQDKRTHMRAKICPIDGPESLTKSARERRAKEIIA